MNDSLWVSRGHLLLLSTYRIPVVKVWVFIENNRHALTLTIHSIHRMLFQSDTDDIKIISENNLYFTGNCRN
jgi:hypothetical protein